ncbi:hypothetical protein Aeqsu_0728 [Aequorivita sublithincola DSM 14238]|uniref:Uncharacterized protein n=1 Tax=Aequorivita sublithincola (strain DSM 14238 / LMG 21431 / ACAM 643 / 9-3) TaxID=746697 RepID=I3YTB8_AEQSU|nr:DUF6624 domain-containing protein [Aequorivita sublithincola]AFL80236.1 hypothetical protein Aeqsu_0728 [Aequorivita sublithincola DSM 14238]
MIRSLLLFFAFALSSVSYCQEINLDLKNELKLILLKDQGFRELFIGGISDERKQELLKELSISEKDFSENEMKLFNRNDSLNLVEVEKIIKEYGYPEKSLVGEPENEAAWFVIQHSDKIEEYFPLIEKASEKVELKRSKVAMMEDRMLMHKGEPQIYGTQGKDLHIVNDQNKQKEFFQLIWPIKNPENVNELRKTVGLNSTIEDYAQQLGIEYKVYTIEEVN